MALRSAVVNWTLDNWKLLFAYTIFICVGIFAVQTYRSWYRLRHFKGPFLATVSKAWLVGAMTGGNCHLDWWKVNERYGTLARIGPNDLITSDPAVLRKILTVRSLYRRSDWYVGMRLDPTRDNVESQLDEVKHGVLRAKMASGYSGKENDHLEDTLDRNVLSFVDLIEKRYLTTDSEYRPVDFGRKTQYLTLDVISDVAYGEPFGFLDRDDDVFEYLKTTSAYIPVVMLVTVLPWLNAVLQSRLLKGVLPSEKDLFGMGKIIASVLPTSPTFREELLTFTLNSITKRVVGERFGPNAIERRDMLGSFVRHGLTQDEAESETILQVVAGSDTTAGAIRATLLYVITNPRVYQNLAAEIRNAQISSPVRDAEAKQLPYLQAVIREGLRMHPPVAALMSKVVPEGGDTFDGRFVPAGTKISYSAWGVYRNKRVWGEDANTFRPERWLLGSPEKIKEAKETWEFIFGGGRYKCLGQNVALMELNKVFVELFRRFEVSVVDPSKPWKISCAGVFMISDMWLVFTKRADASKSG